MLYVKLSVSVKAYLRYLPIIVFNGILLMQLKCVKLYVIVWFNEALISCTVVAFIQTN